MVWKYPLNKSGLVNVVAPCNCMYKSLIHGSGWCSGTTKLLREPMQKRFIREEAKNICANATKSFSCKKHRTRKVGGVGVIDYSSDFAYRLAQNLVKTNEQE
uniref:Uncharacterized protein n=1 Tax=Romanomermis culicivorax TaxID=13658 RepID=A0A915J8Q0_ROMCU